MWISYAIGKKLDSLKDILLNKNIQSYICDELVNEFMEVSSRSRLRKYISDIRRNETIKIMLIMSKKVNIKMKITAGNAPKDFYLLSLAKQIKADYLITDDAALLALNPFFGTKIVRYNEFVEKIV